jgi:hypothetical protein
MAQEDISPSEEARECVRTVCCHDADVLAEDEDRRFRLMPS